jgi:hypothetical protein
MRAAGPFVMDGHDRVLKVRARERVERAERLVEQEHLGLHGERAGKTDALLHAAGNLRRPLVLGMRHLHQLEIVHGPGMAPGARLRAGKHLVDRKPHIVVDGEPGQQRVVLEHDRTVGAGFIDLVFLEQDAAESGSNEARNDVEQRGLSAAGVTDDRNVFAPVDAQGDVLEHLGLLRPAGEGLVDMVDLEIAGHRPLHQLAAVPRVTTVATPATMRSSTKPTRPI